MSKVIIAQEEEIVIGVDVSDKKHNCAVVDMRGNLLADTEMRTPTAEKWESFIRRRLPGCAITVVYEAGAQGFTLNDVITALGHTAVVVAPQKIDGVKTDKRDARVIARDYLAGRAKKVTVPCYQKRCDRQALRLRQSWMKERTRLRNKLSSLRRFHGQSGSMRGAGTDIRGVVDFCAAKIEEAIAYFSGMIAELDTLLQAIAGEDCYREDIQKLISIKGVGPICALEIVLDVADIRAFGNADKFASHTGLCPGERSSGERRRQGSITRHGPGRLRGALMQCAWASVRHDPAQAAVYEKLCARRGKKKAIVAMARRLARTIWFALNTPATV